MNPVGPDNLRTKPSASPRRIGRVVAGEKPVLQRHIVTVLQSVTTPAKGATLLETPNAVLASAGFAVRYGAVSVMLVWTAPSTASMCQNEVVEDLKQRRPSVEHIIRIGMDTLRIPMMPDGYSNVKPDIRSNFMPDTIPI